MTDDVNIDTSTSDLHHHPANEDHHSHNDNATDMKLYCFIIFKDPRLSRLLTEIMLAKQEQKKRLRQQQQQHIARGQVDESNPNEEEDEEDNLVQTVLLQRLASQLEQAINEFMECQPALFEKKMYLDLTGLKIR